MRRVERIRRRSARGGRSAVERALGHLAYPARMAHRFMGSCARPNNHLAGPARPGAFRHIFEVLAACARLVKARCRPREALLPRRTPAVLLAATLLLGICLLLLSPPTTAGPSTTLYV